jgi:parallel beta-helix repeat protein
MSDFSLVISSVNKSAALILIFALILPLSCSFTGRPNHLIETAWYAHAEGSVTSLALEWNRTYGGVEDDEPWAIIQTADGGYALTGSTYSFGAGGGDVWLVRTDDSGNMLWNKTYGGASTDVAYSIIQTNDGGYALAGTTYSSGAGLSDFWLLKTDRNGTAMWSKTYGGTGNDIAMSMVQTVDGDYALVGSTQSFGAGNWDAWLVKTDKDGNVLFDHTYGGTGNDGARSLVQTSDGGFAMTGSTVSFSVGLSDFWLIKTDANGTTQWSKTYGGSNWDDPYAMIQTSDGGYVLAGCSQSFGSGAGDFWLIKTDASGNHVWNKTYGGTSEDRPYSLTQTFDGGYALVGYTYSFGAGDSDLWFVRTSTDGNARWNQTYGGTSEDYARSMVQTSDGGYALGGSTRSFGAGGVDYWLIKTAGESSAIIVPDQYLTIQEAVNNAADGDTIFVRAGTYYEHVVVNKTLSLVGENVSTTIVDGNETGRVIDVVSDNVNITRFTVQRGGSAMLPDLDAGVCLDGVRGCTISGNNIVDNGCFGIHLLNGEQNVVSGNNLARNTWFAIEVTTSSNNIISSNIAIFNPNIGIGMHASSHNNIISQNTVINNTYGIELNDVRNSTISGNSVANNAEIGIWMQTSTVDSAVCGNNIADCRYGIYIEAQANDNTIVQNNIGMNDYGFYIESSTQNYIYHNNILNNTQQTYIALGSVNIWDNGYPSGGNYWSDYSGLDLFSGLYQNVTGEDGLGDTPYVIDADNVDNYPLMTPWSRLLGDVNDDGTVDIFDAILLSNAFNSAIGMPHWNPEADLNNDNVIDIFDAIILASNFGKRT